MPRSSPENISPETVFRPRVLSFIGLAPPGQRIDFVARPFSASTVGLRIAGYEDALRQNGTDPDPAWVHWGDPEDETFVKKIVESGASAVICANDVTAGELMHSLDNLGVSVPDQVRVAGFDDVRYAKLLRIPLTTIHQPCAHIGVAAVSAMLSRIERPDLPARSIQLEAPLVIHQSCGSRQKS